MTTPLFLPGRVLATPGALNALEQAGQKASEFLGRHLAGDWDVVSADDKAANDVSLKDGDRHGIGSDRLALFGVSMGCPFTGLAFTRDGLGQRLLGVVGHTDLQSFARSYAPAATAVLASPLVRWIAKPLSWGLGQTAIAARDLVMILDDLRSGSGSLLGMEPMTFVERVKPSRRVRFLLGQQDSLVRVRDGHACAGRFADGAAYEVGGLGHGNTATGPSFVDHVRYFLGTQLGDWQW